VDVGLVLFLFFFLAPNSRAETVFNG
jgi:hypothetical protein